MTSEPGAHEGVVDPADVGVTQAQRVAADRARGERAGRALLEKLDEIDVHGRGAVAEDLVFVEDAERGGRVDGLDGGVEVEEQG